MTGLTDTHAHLNMLDVSPEQALREAGASGVERVITIGTCPEDHPVVLSLAKQCAPRVFCTLGVHPHDAEKFDSNCEKFMLENLGYERVVAVGEIGLDYYYEHSPREIQQRVFRRQIEIAIDAELPVQIHTREAEEDTIRILNEFGGKVRGLLHCFTGTQWLADRALDLGLHLSISGVVTFKNADGLREIVSKHPLEALHVETDSPFLAPVPFRGQKNQPKHTSVVADKICELKAIDRATLEKQIALNTKRIFSKID